jgi:hypothetical protein
MANGKNARIASEEKLIEGTTKHPGKGDIINGKSYSSKDIVSVLEERIAASAAVLAARAEWQAKVRAEREKLQQTDKLVAAYRQTLLIKYASSEAEDERGADERLHLVIVRPRGPPHAPSRARRARSSAAMATRSDGRPRRTTTLAQSRRRSVTHTSQA